MICSDNRTFPTEKQAREHEEFISKNQNADTSYTAANDLKRAMNPYDVRYGQLKQSKRKEMLVLSFFVIIVKNI